MRTRLLSLGGALLAVTMGDSGEAYLARDLGVEATRLRCCRLGKEERKSGGRTSTSTWARRNMKRRQEQKVLQWGTYLEVAQLKTKSATEREKPLLTREINLAVGSYWRGSEITKYFLIGFLR